MKKIILSFAVIAALGFTSCSSDDDGDGGGGSDACQTCAAYSIAGIDVPALEVCEGENGNAFVAGQDTTQVFADYITSQEVFTTCE